MAKHKAKARPHRFSAEGDFIERLEGPERRAAIPREEIIPRMNLNRDDTLVDLGSGVGYFSVPIAKRVKTVVSVDLEPKMHEILSSRILGDEIENIELLRAEITDLPIADDSVDHVLAAFVYHEVEAPRRLMNESARVLRLGGTLTVLDFQKRETSIGPPLSERKTPRQVVRSSPKSLVLESTHETEVFYMLVFRNRAA
jgi:ubiquinone/menaquinone biosynthesis C-methylase UbiE